MLGLGGTADCGSGAAYADDPVGGQPGAFLRRELAGKTARQLHAFGTGEERVVHRINAAREGTPSADRAFGQGLDVTFSGTENFSLGDDITLSGPQRLFALSADFMIGGKQQNRDQKQPDAGKMAENLYAFWM